MSKPTMTIVVTKAGTYTMYLQRPGKPRERWRSGVPTLDEALHRCKLIADWCGYRVDRKVRAT
jgi:hypothetical protein